MTDHEDILERAIQALKEPVQIDPDLDRRVMAAVEQVPLRAPRTGWLTRRWTIRVSPLGGLAAAAVLAAIVVAPMLLMRGRAAPTTAFTPDPTAGTVTQFVLVAPDAQSVVLVGDFNDWSPDGTRLARQPGDGVWWVTVPLSPGRYRYAFIVDGTSWRRDPATPAAEDEFGRPNSVVTIGGT